MGFENTLEPLYILKVIQAVSWPLQGRWSRWLNSSGFFGEQRHVPLLFRTLELAALAFYFSLDSAFGLGDSRTAPVDRPPFS